MQKVYRLHAAGIRVGSLDENNVIYGKKGVFIIGFQDAILHECDYTTELPPGELQPYLSVVGCSEIYDVMLLVQLYHPGMFPVWSSGHPLTSFLQAP